MILCHKCSGVLAGNKTEIAGLSGCGCISGWIRGFEPSVSREEAIAAQELKKKHELSRLNSQAVNYKKGESKMTCPKCKKVSAGFALPKSVLCADCAWTREENGKNSSFSNALALALAKKARA
jgi:DNA-directed RNA polymerase subunit M/transcription elongation factor TFIIS